MPVQEQLEREVVEPLAVVEEDHRGTRGGGERVDECGERGHRARLAVLLRAERHRRARGQELRERRERAAERLHVLAEPAAKRVGEPQVLPRCSQDLPCDPVEHLQRTLRCRVRARAAQDPRAAPPGRHRRMVEHPGLADARLAVDEQQDGLAGERSRELLLERAQLLVAPDEGRLRQRPPQIVRADGDGWLADAALQPHRDLVEVRQDGGRGLVPVPRVLLEEVLDDVVERTRDGGASVQPRRLRREVLPQDLAHRRAHEWWPSREALEEDDPRRVEIRAFADLAVDEPGLLRRHVADRPDGHVAEGRVEVRTARKAEVDEGDALRRRARCDDDVRRLCALGCCG